MGHKKDRSSNEKQSKVINRNTMLEIGKKKKKFRHFGKNKKKNKLQECHKNVQRNSTDNKQEK